MNEILKKENIFIECEPDTKENIIRKMGVLFFQQGYVDEPYIQAMLDKEVVFNTAIGNELAIPHGIESARGYIKKSGIIVMVFPKGIDWEAEEKVKLVIGIAANGEEHMEILSRIAETCSDTESVEELINSTKNQIYAKFVEA